MKATQELTESAAITLDQLLEQWQGHRRLTRRVIEAFPEDRLFTFSVGNMRPFAQLALEMIQMVPGVTGVVTGQWPPLAENKPATKAELLKLWDDNTALLEREWPGVTAERMQLEDAAFGQWKNKNYATVFYFIDNEIHHRAQGYVYLRALGIEPPAFYDRN